MKSWFLPAAVFGTICVLFLGFLAGSTGLLPTTTIATHFDGAGNANGWMSRSSYLWFTGGMGLGVALFIVGIMAACASLPAWMVNLPNKDYWLSPAQRSTTRIFLVGHSFWLASLILAFFAGLHYLTIQANRVNPARLPNTFLTIALPAFLIGVGLWSAILLFRFRKPA